MRKLLVFLSALALLLLLTACGANTAPDIVDLPMEIPVKETPVAVNEPVPDEAAAEPASEAEAPAEEPADGQENGEEPTEATPAEPETEPAEAEPETTEETAAVDSEEFRSMMSVLLMDYVKNSSDTNAELVRLYFFNHYAGIDRSEVLHFYVYGATVYPTTDGTLSEKLVTQLDDNYAVDGNLYLVTYEADEDGNPVSVTAAAMVYESGSAAPGEANWVVELAESVE